MNLPTRFATVTILGEPNAGKSTLLNAIVGQKLAAVHRRPQMTRHNRLGVWTKDNVQLAFVDTPGFHKPRFRLNSAMVKELQQALEDCDITVVLVDVMEKMAPILKSQVESLLASGRSVLFALNKIDLANQNWAVNEKTITEFFPGEAFCFLSAKSGRGVDGFLETLGKMAPEAAFQHDLEIVTTASLREMAVDFIRQAMMDCLGQELPYQTTVLVESYTERPKRDLVKAVIVVNRESQKGMVIGKGGKNIGRIRELSEKELAEVAGKSVELKLFVRVDADWVDDITKVQEYL